MSSLSEEDDLFVRMERRRRRRTPSTRCVEAMQCDFYGLVKKKAKLGNKKVCGKSNSTTKLNHKKRKKKKKATTTTKNSQKIEKKNTNTKTSSDVLDRTAESLTPKATTVMLKCCGCQETHFVDDEEISVCCMCFGSFHKTNCRSNEFSEHRPFTCENVGDTDKEGELLTFQSVPTCCEEEFCFACKRDDLRPYVTPYRLGRNNSLTKGGRHLLCAIATGRTPSPDGNGRIKDPFGCVGFEYQKQAISPHDASRLLSLVGERPSINWEMKLSMLTPSITDKSCKVIACNDEQRQLRGGRYSMLPLRPSSTVPLLNYSLENGT
eukprot:m.58912 g.58912  ORF g.58912 m.58912 type:complete len:322 (+) comp11291_c0_seq2:140-1105(+)